MGLSQSGTCKSKSALGSLQKKPAKSTQQKDTQRCHYFHGTLAPVLLFCCHVGLSLPTQKTSGNKQLLPGSSIWVWVKNRSGIGPQIFSSMFPLTRQASLGLPIFLTTTPMFRACSVGSAKEPRTLRSNEHRGWPAKHMERVTCWRFSRL